jgi:cell division protein FtsL
MGNPPPKSRRRNPKMLAVWIGLLCVVVGELLVYTWVRVQWFQLGYEISNLTKEQQHLNELQANLKVELARLRAPQRIIRIAQEKLGLTLPASNQMKVMP